MTTLMSGLRVEFDRVNKVSAIRVGGRLTDESLVGLYEECHRYFADTDASLSIVDLSSVTEFALSCNSIRNLADRRPAKADAICVLVAPEGHPYGLCRVFQIAGAYRRPLLQVVHTLGEAFAALGIQSAHFEPSVVLAPFRSLFPDPTLT